MSLVKKNWAKFRRRILLKERDYVRPSAVAGLFYPSDKVELDQTVRTLLKKAKADVKIVVPEKLFGIISPHAGYPYSGYTAAHGYSLLSKGDFETVVVISPSHREYFDGISVFSGRAYSTPLGEVEVDHELRDFFLENAGNIVIESRAGHKSEHALEVQLPFLQLTIEDFKILPIVMGDQRPEYCRVLGNIVADMTAKKNVLVVASSDLSHYYDYETANEIDKVCIDDISRFDPDYFLSDLETRKCEACGGGPIASCLYAGKKAGSQNIDILYHCNSGDTTGDKTGVVGYLSAVIS